MVEAGILQRRTDLGDYLQENHLPTRLRTRWRPTMTSRPPRLPVVSVPPNRPRSTR